MKLTTINGRNIITANESKVLTNGDVYGKVLYLAEGVDPNTFYEISDEEYLLICDTAEDK